MLGVEVLRAEDLRRVPAEGEPSGFAEIPASEDSVSNSDNDTNKSFNSELNINEEFATSPQTDFVAKMKNNKISPHEHKPYDQLSEIEKQRLMEKQSRRRIRLREEMRRYGINRSISHLGKDDLVKSNDNGIIGHRRRENSTCSAASLESSGDDLSPSSSFEEEEVEYWYQSGFGDDDYENHRPSKELIQNYMEMEDEHERLKKLAEAREEHSWRCNYEFAAEMEKIRVFREEIEMLSKENDVLQLENEKLLLRLSSKTG